MKSRNDTYGGFRIALAPCRRTLVIVQIYSWLISGYLALKAVLGSENCFKASPVDPILVPVAGNLNPINYWPFIPVIHRVNSLCAEVQKGSLYLNYSKHFPYHYFGVINWMNIFYLFKN